MACFIVPMTEAVVTTAINKVVKNHEKDVQAADNAVNTEVPEVKIPMSKKLSWLNSMLWGGSALLAFEHVWHGEVIPYFPFLTAAANAEDAAEMLHEMSTTGVGMAIAVTCVWAGITLVANNIMKKNASEVKVEEK